VECKLKDIPLTFLSQWNDVSGDGKWHVASSAVCLRTTQKHMQIADERLMAD